MFRIAVAAFLLVSVLAAAQSPSAIVQPANVDPAGQQAKAPDREQYEANDPQQVAATVTATTQVAQASGLSESAKCDEHDCDRKQDSFWYRFLHEINVTDAIIALFTVVLAVATIGLWTSTKNLWTEAKSQASLARDEFHTAHTPSLEVRRVRLRRGMSHEWGINFVLVNTGDLPAAKIGATFNVVVAKAKKGPRLRRNSSPNYEAPLRPLSECFPSSSAAVNDLAPGRRQFLFVPSPTITDHVHTEIVNGVSILVFMGLLTYEDRVGNLKESAFYRTYIPSKDHFARPKQDPDYERTPMGMRHVAR